MISLLLAVTSLLSAESADARQVHAYLKIHDPRAAADVAKALLEKYPESHAVHLAYIQALAEKGDETAVFHEWSKKRETFLKDRQALETLAWSVIKKGELSPQVQIHLSSLIGASITRDVRAIPMLISALKSSSAHLRLYGARFAGMLGDGPLQQELARLLVEEPVWFVRHEVIDAIGNLRILSLKPQLVKIVADPRTLAEEKAKAILALVQMYDGVREDDLQSLLNSSRAGLKQLGCELVAYFDLIDHAPKLFKLLKDSSPDVRSHALRTLTLLKVATPTEELMSDSHPEVAITAAWAACRQNDESGREALVRWLSDIHPQWRWMAASILPKCGPMAHSLLLEQLEKHEDPFVKVNLALGMAAQRIFVAEATQTIDTFFRNPETGPLMWDNSTSTQILVPNTEFHIQQVQNYPLIVDQMTRLDLLNLLCILKYPHAQETVKEYLKKETLGVTGAAVSVLLQEGDNEALTIIRSLLQDKDKHIRLQAAIMLAVYGNDPEALQVLHNLYPEVSRDLKIHILEAIGHVGSQDSIPFLVDILAEPFQLMRVVSASAIIQCLYH